MAAAENLSHLARSAIASLLLLMAGSLNACADDQEPVPQPVPPALPAPIIGGGLAVPDNLSSSDGPSNLFATDRVAARRLRLAEKRIAEGVYDEAVELLQAVLDAEEDSAAPVGDQPETFQSLKRQALEMLSRLPEEGRRVYEIEYGIAARGRLAKALETGDWSAIETLSRRFFHTAAGQEATYRLAVRAQDRGEPLHAALLYARLSKSGSDAFEPQLSLRATAAWMQADMPDAARTMAKRFIERSGGNVLDIGGSALGEFQDSVQLLTWLKRNTYDSGARDPSWPVFGGSADRVTNILPVAIASGLEWLHEIDAPTEWSSVRDESRAEYLSAGLDLLTAAAERSGELIQPAFQPVVAGNVVVFRTLQQIRAVDLSTGKLLWHTERPHDLVFDRAVSQLRTLVESEFEGDFAGLQLGDYIAELAWRNATTGSIATDGRYVYGIEGTGRALAGGRISIVRGGRPVALGEDSFNTLYAYDLAAEGRIAWTAGGPPTQNAAGTGQFFLGPPLPLGGRLYSLIEEDGVIRLVAMDPSGRAENRVLWSQTLLTAEQSLKHDPLRRISGLSPAFSDGILVCPTGAGAVVAVDLSQRVLLWGYQYQRNYETRQQRNVFGVPQFPLQPNDAVDRWLDAVPRIIDGMVFLTPRDSNELHCLDLNDGRRIWTQPRAGMLYLGAVRDGKVVMIGRRTVAALDLTTGETVWERPLAEGQPAGHGLASGDVYHLPLDSGEVATIHLSTGQVLARSPIGDGIAPGNLIAIEGRLLFQSTTALGSFYRADGQKAQRQEMLPQDADPEALALRGENRLHRGETESGLADLRRATEQADLPRAKRLLVAAMLDGLRTNFAAYRRYEPDLLKFADDPWQRTRFLRLFADGLYEAGDQQAAVTAYLRLADGRLPPFQPESVEQQRLVRPDRMIQVRVSELYEAASPVERSELDGALGRHLQRLTDAGDDKGLERFASLFRGTPYGKQALRLLAEHYRGDDEPLRLEQTLLRIEDIARADDRSAGVLASAGFDAPENAAGAAAFDRSYRGEFLPDEIKSGHEATQIEISFDAPVVGASPRGFEHWQFSIDASRRFLVARDGSGRPRWKLDIGDDERNAAGAQSFSRAQVRFSGRLMAFVAGMRLFVVDLLSRPDQPSILWSRDLTDRGYGEIDINRRMMGDPVAPCGPIGFAGADQLLYQIGSTVTAADPLTGDVIWQRGRLPYGCELSGDRDFVVLQPFRAAQAFVLRAADGSEVAIRPTEESHSRVGWQDTQLISWRRTDDACELSCRDVARRRESWMNRFPATAKQMALASGEIAVLDPPSGKFQLIRPDDGKALFLATIHPDPAVDRFVVMRCTGRWLLFTRHPVPAGPTRVEADRSRFPVDGLAYAFDDEGRRLWSSVIRRQYLSTDQPAELPFLFLTAKLHRVGERPSYRGTVLDVRTGELLVDRERAQEFMPFKSTVDSSTGVVSIQVPEGHFALTPLESSLPPPRSDGPDELRASS